MLCPSVIGRTPEIEALTAALQQATDSRGSAFFLVGEAGIGKSRLTREAIALARDGHQPVFFGRATQSGETIAFRPLSEALLSYARDQDLEDLPHVAELEPFRHSLARLVPQWRRPDAEPGEDSLVLVAEAILRLLRVVGRDGGCLLVLEDLHWADPETLAIVEYLCGHLASEPIVLLCTVRANEASAANRLVDELAARRAASIVVLQRLTTDETIAMAVACLRLDGTSGAVPEAVRSLLASNADGLPFFVEELLAGAVDAGALVATEDGWTVHGQVAPQVPRTFHDSVERRMTSLGEAAHIIVTAAVLGRRFEWALLRDVVGEAPATVLSALRAGVAAQLLIAEPGTAGMFRFRHALTRDAVLGGLLPVEWAELARQTLDAVLAAHPDLPGEWCDLSAQLAERAGDPRAAALFIESGRRSMARGALASAEETFGQARQLAVDPAVAANAMEALCETFALAGKLDEALAVGAELARALPLLGAPSERLGHVHARLAHAAAVATRWDVAEEHLAAARSGVAQADDVALLTRADVIAAQIALGRGEFDQASDLANGALEQARRLILPELMCEALWVIGQCERTTDLSRAEAAFLQAVEIAEQHGLEVFRVRSLFEVGTIDFLTLRTPMNLEAARELATATGALATAWQIDAHLSAWYTFHFDSEAAITAGRRAGEAARWLGSPEFTGIALIAEAGSHGRLGRRAEMDALVAEALDIAGDVSNVAGLAWGLCRAEISLIDENRARALRELDTMMGFLRELPTNAPLPQRGLWALLRAVENVEAEEACAEVRASGATAMLLNAGFLQLADAVLAGRAGRAEEADRSFTAGTELIAHLTWYRSLAVRFVAEAAIADGWGDPAEWLREALTQFEEYGQDQLAAACRSLLKKAGAPVPRRGSEARVPIALRQHGVTEREAEVLALLAVGLGNKEIATRLYLSPRTVERHIANISAKTDVRTRSELVAFAARTAQTG